MNKDSSWKKAKTRWYITSYISEDSYVTRSSSFWLTSADTVDSLHKAIDKLIHDHPNSRCVVDICNKCERKGWHEHERARSNKRV